MLTLWKLMNATNTEAMPRKTIVVAIAGATKA